MDLIETLMGSAGTAVVGGLAKQFGVNPDQATAVMTTIFPALAGGLKAKVDAGGGSGLMDLITGGSLTKFASDPSLLSSPAAIDTGKNLLTQLFGGGDLSNVASGVAEKTGVGAGVIQSMLPVLATAFMGFLSNKAAGKSTSELTDMLGLLAGDGSGLFDNLKSMAAKIFGGN
jgi:hypothetical protein